MLAGRSYEPITPDDLARLDRIARADQERFLDGHPEYRDRVLCTALCQGAGLHYVDAVFGHTSINGIKDFDVWTFFVGIAGQRFPADRRMTHVDFGPSKFGRWDEEPSRFRRFTGRRVDLLMRALPVRADADPAAALRTYLHRAHSTSAKLLAMKGVVIIGPEDQRGKIAWPTGSPAGYLRGSRQE